MGGQTGKEQPQLPRQQGAVVVAGKGRVAVGQLQALTPGRGQVARGRIALPLEDQPVGQRREAPVVVFRDMSFAS